MLAVIQCRDNHSRRANPALRSAVVVERRLNRMKVPALSRIHEPLNGRNVFSLGLTDGNHTAQDEKPVHDDGTRAALPFPAAFLATGQPEIFSKDVEQTF